MKNLMTTTLLISIMALMVPGFGDAHVSQWQKGASIVPTSKESFSSREFKRSLDNLQATNANYVSLVVPYYQANESSPNILTGWNTPTDDSLAEGIDYAREIGLKVMLKPHVELMNGGWRAYINPPQRDVWFQSYSSMLQRLAALGAEHNVEEICIGSEMISVASDQVNPDNGRRWRSMIDEVKKVYSGKLTYGANWGGANSSFLDEKGHISFWDKLDYIGISAYYTLSGDDVAGLMQSWNKWNMNDIEELHKKYDKPLIFTEVGYRSIPFSFTNSYDYLRQGPYDEDTQAKAYEALFSYWNNYDYMQGIFMWSWEPLNDAGGYGDTGYTPQNKAAQSVMAEWFQPMTEISIQVSGERVVEQPLRTTLSITNQKLPISDAIINLEIFDKNGERVYQKYVEGQNLEPYQAVQYNFDWTPYQAEAYTAKASVFKSGWEYYYALEEEPNILISRYQSSKNAWGDFLQKFIRTMGF